ncbi:hypothetical protein HDU87_005444 [Geranomyces variabilis]|uniref:Enoyl reductase (ER) domain-containing protein n=1 Tax=Geranomyces variabilis TaxID=109894 RepID=A0AAD5TGX9_9FUNG|nr:hypothetical protein HDU87_005444 [Geranomyces variabilis]
MRVWEFASAAGGIENHLKLVADRPLPTAAAKTQHLVQVLAVGLNPVDYKLAEARIAKLPTTPGLDFAGKIVVPAENSTLVPGTLVYGASSFFNPRTGGGALAEYIAVPTETVAVIPAGLSPVLAGGAPVAAVTAYQAIVPHVKKPGSRVFINGGSGGTGTYGIQIAKALGAHVTVSCSAANADLCRSIGADDVLDYTSRPVLDQLRDAVAKSGLLYDHVVDFVFSGPELFYQAHTYTAPGAHFVEVAGAPSLAFGRFAFGAMVLPGFLGGGKRKFTMLTASVVTEPLDQIAKWIVEGKIKPVTDQVFPFEQAVEAFRRLKTGRAKGKVIVTVAANAE